MKKLLFFFTFFLFSWAISQTPYITKWQLTGGSGTEEIKFYASAFTASNVTFNYNVEGGQSGSIEVPLPAYNYGNIIAHIDDALVTLQIPRTSTDTTVNISVIGLASFGLAQLGREEGQNADTPISTTTTSLKLLDVLQWGSAGWEDLCFAFYYAENMHQITATDLLNFSTIGNDPNASSRLSRMFYRSNVKTINRINEWDVSKVRNFLGMFQSAKVFNDDISNWKINTTQPVTMKYMFQEARKFNSEIKNWNMSAVNNTEFMFRSAEEFRQIIPQIKMGTQATQMLYGAASYDYGIDHFDYSGTNDFSQYLSYIAKLSPYKVNKGLLKMNSDKTGKSLPTGALSFSTALPYYDATNTYNSPSYPILDILLGTENQNSRNLSLINLKNSIAGTIYYTRIPLGTLFALKEQNNTAVNDIGKISILKDEIYGIEYLAQQTLGVTENIVDNTTYPWNVAGNTMKLDSDGNVFLRGKSYFNGNAVLSYIVNTQEYNVGTKAVVYVKGTTIPQDVSKNGTIVFDFQDQHLYVSKGGIWHRADN